ncbi:MAG: DUF362 domain-containing protein [Candidatus Omnitrophica bacterium]|nr:DUF362 domain-containing protein [Candidatus Omnitrophota bacterium]
MKKITRREFLKKSIGITSALTCAGLWPLTSSAQAGILQPKSEVALVKGNDITQITSQALELLGGVKRVIKPGAKVFIKPNYIAGGFMGHDPVQSGEIPHPEVVAAVAHECVKAGAKQVVIGEWFERPLKIEFGGEKSKYGAQVKKLVEKINKKFGDKVSLVDLRKYTKSFIYVPSSTKIQWLAIPNLVAEADTVISVAVLKTHHRPISVTFGMKNFVGIMPSILYGEPRMKLHEAGINQVILDIVKGIKPKLTVISGVYGMEGEGVVLSFGGKPVDIASRIGGAVVIAGFDPVATDATATRLITKNWQPQPRDTDLGVPWYVKHLRMAYNQGIGQIHSSHIEIKGERLDDLAMSWLMPGKNTYPELPNYVNNL